MKPEGWIIAALWLVMRVLLLGALGYLFWREVRQHRAKKKEGGRSEGDGSQHT
jgi:hypothetical protein